MFNPIHIYLCIVYVIVNADHVWLSLRPNDNLYYLKYNEDGMRVATIVYIGGRTMDFELQNKRSDNNLNQWNGPYWCAYGNAFQPIQM